MSKPAAELSDIQPIQLMPLTTQNNHQLTPNSMMPVSVSTIQATRINSSMKTNPQSGEEKDSQNDAKLCFVGWTFNYVLIS